jgi:ABC-type uncharacterized transport system auxiliary subunit
VRGARRALLLLGLLLAACGGAKLPRDHYYRLEAAPPADPLAVPCLLGSLRVTPLRSDALTRGTVLLRSNAARPHEVLRDPYRHWVDSPTTLLQRAIADFLRQARVADVVLPVDTTLPADWLVGGRILRLETVVSAGGSHALVELELNLVRGGGREIVFHRSYREERPSPAGAGGAAAGINAALDGILERFLADLVALDPSPA